MDFPDYFAVVEPLQLPIGGKVYTIPPISAQLGLTFSGALKGTDSSLEKLETREFWALVLGVAYTEMVTDNVPDESIERAGLTALADYQIGRDHALLTWKAGMDPEARAALTAAITKSAVERVLGMTSTSTAGVKKTQPRASTKATTSLPATRRSSSKAKPSSGR